MNDLVNLSSLSTEELHLMTSRILSEQMLRIQNVVEKLQDEVEKVKTQGEISQHRLDNLDLTNIEGTERQRLSAMVRKYALDNGMNFPMAWRKFVTGFNTAYRKNLVLLRRNYAIREGKSEKRITIPDILEAHDLMRDAIRVADKMLNGGYSNEEDAWLTQLTKEAQQ